MNSMTLAGFAVGCFVGTCFGILLISMLIAAKRFDNEDDCEEVKDRLARIEYAVRQHYRTIRPSHDTSTKLQLSQQALLRIEKIIAPHSTNG